MVETRDVTWEAPPVLEVPPPLIRLPELGEASELGAMSESGGRDYYCSTPPTPLPLLGRGVPHQLRVVASARVTGDCDPGGGGSVDGDSPQPPDNDSDAAVRTST